MHSPAGDPGTCRNCGAKATSRFCSECGQTTVLHQPTVREFVHEFITHSIALEGALWGTLAALLLRPGWLTVAYFSGRRARYIAPLRLYLTFSLIFFAISGLSGSTLRFGGNAIEFRLPEEARDAAIVIGPRFKTTPHSDIAFIDRAIQRVEAMAPAERQEKINTRVRQYLPYVLIVLVPVLALFLKLAYWSRHRLYGEHLVVAFHAQTVAFIFVLIAALPLGDWFNLFIVALLIVHGCIALRRVYGGSWIGTIGREAAVLLAHGFVVSVSLAALATLALAL